MRLFISGARKLVRRPASWVTLLLTVALVFLVFVAVGTSSRQVPDPDAQAGARLLLTFPGAYDFILSFILGLGGLLAVVYAAAVAGSEWSWGTLKVAIARGESRVWYVLMTFASIALLLAIGLLVAFALGIVAALIGAGIAGIPADGLGDPEALGMLPEQLARGTTALVMQGAIGFAIATVARSQIAGVAVGIGVYFAEQFATIFLPDQVQYLPFHVATAVISGGAVAVDGQTAQLEDPNLAIALVMAWLVGSIAAAAVITDRADIGG